MEQGPATDGAGVVASACATAADSGHWLWPLREPPTRGRAALAPADWGRGLLRRCGALAGGRPGGACDGAGR